MHARETQSILKEAGQIPVQLYCCNLVVRVMVQWSHLWCSSTPSKVLRAYWCVHSAFAVKQVAAVQTVAPLDQVAVVLATVFQYTVVTMHFTHHVSALNIRVAPTHSFTPGHRNLTRRAGQ
jgi:hypothetical protein